MTYIGKYEYKPSQAVLDRVLPELLDLRKSIADQLRQNWEAQRSLSGFHGGISDEQEDERQRQVLYAAESALTAKRDLVDQLLRPFEQEAREFKEKQDKRECDGMMAL